MAANDQVSRIVDHFENRILSGDLAPGAALPPERALCDSFKVGRSTVREALGRLGSLGLVRTVHGSGTRVEAPSGRPIAEGYQRLMRRAETDLPKLAQVRLVLETAIAGLAALHRTDGQLSRMEATQAALSDSAGGLESHVRADLEFHALLAEASGNPFFGIVLAPIQELLIQSRRKTLGRHGAALAFDHHASILAAVRDGDEASAVEEMRRHLQTNVRHLTDDAINTGARAEDV